MSQVMVQVIQADSTKPLFFTVPGGYRFYLDGEPSGFAEASMAAADVNQINFESTCNHTCGLADFILYSKPLDDAEVARLHARGLKENQELRGPPAGTAAQ